MRWKRIVGGICVTAILVFAFWYGGNAPENHGFTGQETVTEQREYTKQNVAKNREGADTSAKSNEKESGNHFFEQLMMKITHIGSSNSSQKGQSSKKAQKNAEKAVKNVEKQKKKTQNKKKEQSGNKDSKQDSTVTTEEKTETQESDVTKEKTDTAAREDTEQEVTTQVPDDMISCTIRISCTVLLNQMDLLNDNKKKVVPKNGVILEDTKVTVQKGSTVFDVLQKVTKEQKIQLEYNYTPSYKNYYIEGIGNLYEFDAGNLSGWMYSVNNTFSGCGCSAYTLKDGDVIRWMYTCNLGKDVGDYFEDE